MLNIKSNAFERCKLPLLLNKLMSQQSILLFGPRQTGKSTLCEHIFSELPKNQQLTFALHNPKDCQELEADNSLIQRQVEALGVTPVYVYIDEIQKLPQLLDTFQYLIDKGQVVLLASGSSARKMRKQSTNWLPGRVHKEHLYPLTWQESLLFEHPQKINEYLLWGFLPGILMEKNLENRKQSLESYTALYLEEEIRREALVRNLPQFREFLQLAALESGTCPNFSKLAQQIGISPPTVAEYYNILEDTLVLHRLPRFGKNRNCIISHTKNYFFDLGVRNSAARIGHSEGIITLQKGVLFEHFIILEAIAQFSNQAKFSFWSNKKHEVDLILEFPDRRIAIEIKSTNKPQKQHFLGLESLCQEIKVDASYVVCQIDRPQKFGNHLAISWMDLFERINKS